LLNGSLFHLSANQSFKFNNCESSGYLNNPIFQNSGFKEAMTAKDETIKTQAELISFLKERG